jgi:hypothetical protein
MFCDVEYVRNVESVEVVNGYDGESNRLDLLLRFGIIFEVHAISNYLIAPVQTFITDRKGLANESFQSPYGPI